jgi:hypothetical protein
MSAAGYSAGKVSEPSHSFLLPNVIGDKGFSTKSVSVPQIWPDEVVRVSISEVFSDGPRCSRSCRC